MKRGGRVTARQAGGENEMLIAGDGIKKTKQAEGPMGDSHYTTRDDRRCCRSLQSFGGGKSRARRGTERMQRRVLRLLWNDGQRRAIGCSLVNRFK
jgi:hypothetical protein